MKTYSYRKLSKATDSKYKKYANDSSSCDSSKSCGAAFSELLIRTLCDTAQIRRNIETMYENDPVGVTKPLDSELLRQTEIILARVSVDLLDLVHLLNPDDFVCDRNSIAIRLADARLLTQSIEAQLAFVNRLKSTDDERSLCLAEANFTELLRLVDLLIHTLFYLELLYDCNNICN